MYLFRHFRRLQQLPMVPHEIMSVRTPRGHLEVLQFVGRGEDARVAIELGYAFIRAPRVQSFDGRRVVLGDEGRAHDTFED